MKLKRYSILLTLQLFLLIGDLFLNTFAHLLVSDNLEISILLFVLQDTCIICLYLLFTFAVNSTCAYEVDASFIIFKRCKLFLITIFLYFVISATQHFCLVYNWSATQVALSFVQRLLSCLYYYTYKRTALTLSDSRYFEQNSDRIVCQLGNR